MIRFLKYINRLRMGHRPIFVEYEYDMEPRWPDQGNKFVRDIIENAADTIESNLRNLQQFTPLVRELTENKELTPAVNWKNHFIPALDALSLFWAASNSGSTFVEVGSGNSTIFVRRAIGHLGLNTRLISIDPFPRVDINTLCDEIIRQPLEQVDLTIFDQLQAGDVVFIDNSHRSFMNSDVTVVMLDVLPRLKKGVLIGFHDIFLPFDYFSSWSNRAYNEQYLLGCYLLANPQYLDLQLCNYWITSQRMHVEPLSEIWDLLGEDVKNRSASAFWGVKS